LVFTWTFSPFGGDADEQRNGKEGERRIKDLDNSPTRKQAPKSSRLGYK
jgi:hypothetical protein